jgi:hypothetical protein
MAVKHVSVASFAEQIIAGSRTRLISVPNVVSGIREKLPDCEHTDDELAQIVAMIAVSRGCQLSFVRPHGFEPVR